MQTLILCILLSVITLRKSNQGKRTVKKIIRRIKIYIRDNLYKNLKVSAKLNAKFY